MTGNVIFNTSGNVGIGTTTPGFKLDVQGGQLNASSGLCIAGDCKANWAAVGGGGSGTVTSVASGTGLTGGPITTSGTLAIDTAVVPRLGSANAFSATQTISGGNLALDNTNGSGTAGVITLGGNRFLHNFGTSNTFLGQNAGNFTMTGFSNTATGAFALQANTSGSNNTAIGLDALFSNTTGSFNTSVGKEAGITQNLANANTTGSNNTFIGFWAGPGVASASSLQNATAIGANAVVSANNSLVLGSINGFNGAASNVNVGIGTATPGFSLDVQGGQINASGGLCMAADCRTSWPASGGTGTVTNVATGAGLTGGPITTTGTIAIANAGVTNGMLANSSITVNPGTGLSGGGTVALGGSVTLNNTVTGTVTSVAAGTGLTASPSPITATGTLNIDTTVVPRLGVANTFSAPTSSTNTFTAAAGGVPQTVQTGADANKGVIVKGNSATQSANLQEWQDSAGNALAAVNQSGAYLGPVGMVLGHAEWSVFDGPDAGTTSTAVQIADGVLQSTADPAANSFDDTVDTQGPAAIPDLATGLNRPGAFLTARARWVSTIGSTQVFYVIAGGENSGHCTVGDATFCFQNGFGFKADNSSLKGFTMLGGAANQTVVDLSPAVTLTTNTWVDLMAVRRASSVDFYVNGVFRGSSSTNLPATAGSFFEVRTENGTGGGVAEMQVAMMTVGIPMK